MRKLLLALILPLFLAGCVPNLGNSTAAKKNPREFTQGGLVKSFPDIPFHPDLKIIESYKDENSYGASFVGNKSIENLIKYYQEGLPQVGWEGTLRRQSESGNFVFSVKNAKYQGEVIINMADDGEQTAVTAYVGPR